VISILAQHMIPGEWITGFVVAVIGALAGAYASIKAKAKGEQEGREKGRELGKAEALQIGPQPFIVQLKEEFITRREFEKLEGRLEVHATEMKGLFRETMQAVSTSADRTQKRIENVTKQLTEDIRACGTGAYNGRQKLWQDVNDLREEVARQGVHTDVACKIEKLADAITGTHTPKVTPTIHSGH
jgi:hypothetical protein